MHLLGLLNFTGFISSAGYVAIFLLCVLQSCCVPTSSELTMGFAGALAAQGRLSLAGVILVGVLGEVVGAYIAWAIGRHTGRAAVDRYGRYILVTQRDVDRVEDWYDRHQRFGVFGSRLLPVIRNFVALPAGIAEVPLGRFGLLTAGGSLLWDGAWALIGYAVGSHWHAIASGFSDIGYVLAVVAAGIIAFGVFHRYQSYKNATSGSPPARAGTAPRASSPRHVVVRPAAFPTDDDGRRSSFGPDETDVGTLRWIASSTGRPLALESPVRPVSDRRRLVASSSRRPVAPQSPVASPSGTSSLVASSSGRVVAPPRRSEFPNSSLSAWEAAVQRGGMQGDASSVPIVEEEGEGVEANGRLTAMLGAVLLALLAVEGLTILRITSLVTVHVVIGMVLVPVIALKMGSTVWRFARYYLGSPEYRRKGPPPPVLRLLGPFVVVSTVAVVGSGIALLLAPTNFRNGLLLLHKVTFVLWFAAMIIHVLGHLMDVARLAPRDFYWRTRSQVRGAGLRQWAIVSSVCIGIILAVAVAPKIGPWLEQGLPVHKAAATNTVSHSAGSASRHP